ncbi:MAG: hypothetical protein K0R47_5498 [Brevibacillus sp.]|nr:hypothetical protein [Brevibacillus sp.]
MMLPEEIPPTPQDSFFTQKKRLFSNEHERFSIEFH